MRRTIFLKMSWLVDELMLIVDLKSFIGCFSRCIFRYSRFINHWFPLITPAIKPCFLRGVRLGG